MKTKILILSVVLFVLHCTLHIENCICQFDKPNPKMELGEYKRPSTLNSKPDINKAEKILEANKENSGNNLAEACGTEMFEEAFNLTSAVTSFSQEVLLELPFVETFNSVAGELGLLFSLKQFAFEIYEGKVEQAKPNLIKNLTMYSLGKWGSQGLRIANVGIFFIDYALTKFGTKSLEVIDKKYQGYYDESQKWNSNLRDKESWTKFIVDLVSTSKDSAYLKSNIDSEMNKYLYFPFSTAKGVLIPDYLRENLVAREKEKLLIIMHEALKDANVIIEKNREQDIKNKFAEMRNLLNDKIQIRVYVYGKKEGDKEIVGLPVRIVVDEDENLWQRITDGAGQCQFDATWLGYLHYKKPTTVELVYKGKALRQNFRFDKNTSVDVRFYLDKVVEETGSDFPSNLQGKYSGKITQVGIGPDYKGGNEEFNATYSENNIMDLEKLKNFEIPCEGFERTIVLQGKTFTTKGTEGSVRNHSGSAQIILDGKGKVNLDIKLSSQSGSIYTDNDNEKNNMNAKVVSVIEISGIGNFTLNDSNKYISTIKSKYVKSTYAKVISESYNNYEYDVEVQLEIVGDKIKVTLIDPHISKVRKGESILRWTIEAKKS